MPQERFALDRASVRRVDQDGHLLVSVCNLSAADICPYRGAEIPEADALGLDPNKTYLLYRDADALAKAASTMNGKPVMSKHRPISADDHPHEIVVGAVGSDVRFEAPHLRGSFSVWDGDAISAIESGSLPAVSAGYRYRAIMEPCSVNGQRADGRMVDIAFNHLSLVPEPRVKTAIIGDAANVVPMRYRSFQMTKITAPKSRRGLMATAALSAYLRPKLAADAAIDVGAIVKGVTAKNWKTSKPKIAASLTKATQGKLAQDADLADVIEMLDQLDDMVDDMPDEVSAAPDPADTTEDSDAEMMDRLKDVLKAKGMSDEDVNAVLAAMKPEVDPPAAPAADKVAKDKEPPVVAKKDEKDDKVSKPAMDAALARTRADTEAAVVARMNAIRAAENDVRPIIGEVAMAQDSAADVYRLALDHAGIAHDGVDPSAFPALIAMHKRTLEVAAAPKPRVAMDAAEAKSYGTMFPNSGRLVK